MTIVPFADRVVAPDLSRGSLLGKVVNFVGADIRLNGRPGVTRSRPGDVPHNNENTPPHRGT
jgi:hypothetical protein